MKKKKKKKKDKKSKMETSPTEVREVEAAGEPSIAGANRKTPTRGPQPKDGPGKTKAESRLRLFRTYRQKYQRAGHDFPYTNADDFHDAKDKGLVVAVSIKAVYINFI